MTLSIKHHLIVEQLQLSSMVDSLTSSITFRAQSGDIIGISGTSGTGKSLLLKAVADLIPHQGFVSLNGKSQEDVEPDKWRKQVMLVPAESQWWLDTVQEHFKELKTEHLQQLGLSDSIKIQNIHQLSSGEKQRLAILRAVEKLPKVLLLDEVSANIDYGNTLNLERLIKEYVQVNQAIVLWISHDQQQLDRISNHQFALTRDGFSELV